MLENCCPFFFWLSFLVLWSKILVEVPLQVGLVRKRVLILSRLCPYVFRCLVLFLLNSLAQDHSVVTVVSPSCILESDVSVTWRGQKRKKKKERSGLVGLLVVGRLFWSLLCSFVCFFFRSSSLSPLCGLRPGTGACILLSLSLLYLDDLTMPPYSPHPPPPTTPLSGNSHIFLAESKCWLWLMLLFFSSFLLFCFSLSYP